MSADLLATIYPSLHVEGEPITSTTNTITIQNIRIYHAHSYRNRFTLIVSVHKGMHM